MHSRKTITLLTAALFVMSAAVAFHPRWSSGVSRMNGQPFAFVESLLDPGNTYFELRNVAGNATLYVPAAVAATLMLKSPVAATFLVGGVAALVELLQLLMADRVSDVDDIILALIGALVATSITHLVVTSREVANHDQ